MKIRITEVQPCGCASGTDENGKGWNLSSEKLKKEDIGKYMVTGDAGDWSRPYLTLETV